MKAPRLRLRWLMGALVLLAVALAIVAPRLRPDRPPALARTSGPFMVLASSFRGADAEAKARTLAAELRREHGLPAYTFSLARPVNPRNGTPREPEAAVLVGDCRTIDEAEQILRKVKRIQPKAATAGRGGRGLSRAMLTTNPLVTTRALASAGAHAPSIRGPSGGARR